jgi:uroporphyrin-III C-methyltransferase/precorrin-2 dehydrogenase/sirohydrochlorin ferrochelatase
LPIAAERRSPNVDRLCMSDLLFPVFLKLTGRPVLVVGGGAVAASKIEGLLRAGARVTVVAPEIGEEIAAHDVDMERRPFRPDDLDGVWYVVAAAIPDVNRAVALAAEARRIFVNAVDDPPNASAYLGGVVRRGRVTIAISTEGEAPALAGLLREGIDELLPADLDAWMEIAAAERARWRDARIPMDQRRPLLLDAINRRYEQKR